MGREDPALSQPAISVFLETFVSTRKASTLLALPDSTIKFPSSDLPPCLVRTVEVSYSRHADVDYQTALEHDTDMMLSHMYSPISDAERQVLQ